MKQIKNYSDILKNKYNNISQYDLISALKSIFPKLVSEISFDKFYEQYGGFKAYRYYPDDLSMFDVLVNSLVNEYNVSENSIFTLFDDYFQERDNRLLKSIKYLLANYAPYWQSGSPILKQAEAELPLVKQEYSRRISSVINYGYTKVSLAMALRVKNITRCEYYDIIDIFFKNEVKDLTNYLKNKYPQNTEYIASEILMQILIQDFGTIKPIK